jgi:membrane-associated protein
VVAASIHELITGPWAYAVVFGLAALDAVFPVVPSESTAIAAGVLAGSGDLVLGYVILAAGTGAFIGDSTAYWIGRALGGSILGHRLLRGERGTKAVNWAESTLQKRGGYLIVVARFIPGGRTATTFTAGSVQYSAVKFSLFAGLAAAIWATYAAVLGYLGGRVFTDRPWLGLVVALGLATGITALVEVGRKLASRRKEPR